MEQTSKTNEIERILNLEQIQKSIDINIISFKDQYKFIAKENQNIGDLRNQLSKYLPAPEENIVLKYDEKILDNSEMIFPLFESLDLKNRNVFMDILGPPADLNFEEIPYSYSLGIKSGFSLDIICPNTDCNKRQYVSQKYGQFDINELRLHSFQCCQCKYYCLRAAITGGCFTNCKITIKAIKKNVVLEDTVIVPENIVRSYKSVVHPNWSRWNVMVTPISY